MATKVSATWMRFLTAEAAVLSKGQKVVTISFGGEEGPVTQLAISLEDARESVIKLLSALAGHGDEVAARVFDENFNTE